MNRGFRPSLERLETRCLPSTVTFANATPYPVYFVLPPEVPLALGAGQTQTYTNANYFGPLSVGIYQFDGGRLNFNLWNYGSFVFTLQGPQIVSTFKSSSFTFENQTQLNVSFFLSGGVSGSQNLLNAGQTQSFTVPASVGAPTTLGIYQSDGSRRDFAVADGSHYQFILSNGGVSAVPPGTTPINTNASPASGTPGAANPGATSIPNAPGLYIDLALASARFEGHLARLLSDFNRLKGHRAAAPGGAARHRAARFVTDALPSGGASSVGAEIATVRRDLARLDNLLEQAGESARPSARTEARAVAKASTAMKQLATGHSSAGAASLQAARSALASFVGFVQQALARLKGAVDAVRGFHAECAYSVRLSSAPAGARQLPGEDPRAHRGYDLVLKHGTSTAVPVPAAADGVVVLAKVVGQGDNSFGKTVVVRYEDGGTTQLFGHLKKIDVKVGQKISQGQSVGIQGHTGHATGDHVHTEIGTWKSAKGYNNFGNFKRNGTVAETSKFVATYRSLLTQGAYESQCDAPTNSGGNPATAPPPATVAPTIPVLGTWSGGYRIRARRDPFSQSEEISGTITFTITKANVVGPGQYAAFEGTYTITGFFGNTLTGNISGADSSEATNGSVREFQVGLDRFSGTRQFDLRGLRTGNTVNVSRLSIQLNPGPMETVGDPTVAMTVTRG